MNLLPGFLRLALALILMSFVSTQALAAGPPNPQPCKNPIKIEDQNSQTLTDNYITDADGKAPPNLRWEGDNSLTVTGFPDQDVNLPPVNFTFSVDFSKLQSLFASSSSNDFEGKFQDQGHRFANIMSLNNPDFNSFHGALQKASAKILLDEQKKKYVNYVYNKPTLQESANKYTDIYGAGPEKTIYDLVTEYGEPNPPEPGANDSEKEQWKSTWGAYWEKIPTAWSEFYEGEIAFHYILGNKGLETLKKSDACPPRVPGDSIRFVLPEFYRTTAVTDQINRLFVAKEAQSYQDHGILAETHQNPLAKAFRTCWELIKDSTTNLKKIVRISYEFINPVKVANAAQENQSCLKPLDPGKEGTAPYCPLPFEEANKPGVFCSNKNDSNKLETDNPNVVCTFSRTFRGFVVIDPNSPDFDSCELQPDGRYKCRIPLQIIPNFRIPWLAAIWNSSLYSDDSEHLDNQKKGRPGFLDLGIPKVIQNGVKTDLSLQEILDLCLNTNGQAPLCQELGPVFAECFEATGDYGGCILESLKLPANVQDEDQLKERFIGGVDTNKNFFLECSLMPKAVREELNIKNKCK